MPRSASIALLSAAAWASGVTTLLRSWRRRSGPCVFVLEYHDVTNDRDEPEGVVTAERFRRHLRYLRRHYRLATVSRAAEALRKPQTLEEDVLVLTMDDGLAGNYEAAWPVLRAESAPATIFLTTGFLDGSHLWFDFARRALGAARTATLPRPVQQRLEAVYGAWPASGGLERQIDRLKGLPGPERTALLEALRSLKLDLPPGARPMTWDQVREMQGGGIEMGGHTVSHPILSTLDSRGQEQEILGCRDRIAEATGVRPTTFAMPNGTHRDFDEATLRVLHEAGFVAACTTIRGTNRPGCDPFTLKRIGVGSDSIPVLAARLSGLFDEWLRRWPRGDSPYPEPGTPPRS